MLVSHRKPEELMQSMHDRKVKEYQECFDVMSPNDIDIEKQEEIVSFLLDLKGFK